MDRRLTRQARIIAAATTLAFAPFAPAVRAQDPAQDGEWSAVFELPLIAIHSALLPTGDVLLFSAEHGVPGIHGWLLDPDTLELTNVDPPAPWNPDCAGHSFLPDGRLLVAGGTLSFGPLTGTKLVYAFEPYTSVWMPVEDMAAGRWYPTNVSLPDGRVITMAGLSDVAGVDNPDIELWDPASSANWELIGQKTLPYYPLLHVLSDGLVFKAGPDSATETYDPALDTWTAVATTIFPARFEGTSVLLPPTADRVMLIGGFTGSGAPTNSAEIIDLSVPSPSWTTTAHMATSRMELNAVLLPDGTVFVVGGRSDNDATPTPVMVPERFDPATQTWDQLAPHTEPRRYHSTAILLPDARVLAAGGDFTPSGEIFSPPYLFAGPRPTITSVPPVLAYGTSFSLEFTSSHLDNDIVLVRLAGVTHSNSMGQRYVALGSVSQAGGSVTIAAPANGNLAPPGPYMLFVVDSAGVPSISRIVRVGPDPDPWADLGGAVAGINGEPILAGLGPLDPGSTLTLDLSDGPPGEFALLWVSFSSSPVSAFGGTIHAFPFDEQVLLVTDPTGAFVGTTLVPPGIAAGVELWFQFLCQDLTLPANISLSNAVRATTP